MRPLAFTLILWLCAIAFRTEDAAAEQPSQMADFMLLFRSPRGFSDQVIFYWKKDSGHIFRAVTDKDFPYHLTEFRISDPTKSIDASMKELELLLQELPKKLDAENDLFHGCELLLRATFSAAQQNGQALSFEREFIISSVSMDFVIGESWGDWTSKFDGKIKELAESSRHGDLFLVLRKLFCLSPDNLPRWDPIERVVIATAFSTEMTTGLPKPVEFSDFPINNAVVRIEFRTRDLATFDRDTISTIKLGSQVGWFESASVVKGALETGR